MKKLNRLALTASMLSVLLFVSGCGLSNSLPAGLNDVKKPITLIAKSESGILISDGDGNIYNYEKSYYFAQTIINSKLETGHVIIGKQPKAH